jgi:hypothetical protein
MQPPTQGGSNGGQTQPMQRPGNDNTGDPQAQHQNSRSVPTASDSDMAPENAAN